ncbi:MAG: putative signal transduction histidine kinase [Ferruginibacter sp.]|nr:putative signal transduction histidine kinase [Ferruginibacter sp.]
MTHLATEESITAATNLLVSYKAENLNPEAVIITNPRFMIKGFNDIAASVYGFTSMATIHNQRLFDLVQFDIIGTNGISAMKSLFKNGFWKGDIIYVQNGKKHIFSTHCSLIKDTNGLIDSIVITTEAISQRLKQAKDLASAENKYQTLVESLSEGVMLIGADGIVHATNKKAADIFGITEEQITGGTLSSPQWKTFREDGTEFPREDYPAMITLQTGRENNNVVMRLQHDDGRNVWVSMNSRPIFEAISALPVGVVVSMVEITEVKEINDRLAESESLFRTFMKDSPTLGWICDEEGTLVYGNPRFLDTICASANAIGKNISGFIKSPELLATILKRNQAILEYGGPVIKEEALTHLDGSTGYYLAYWFSLPDKNYKKLIGGHAVEITDKKMAQKEIDKMYERYHFAINTSSDAIWDLDVATGVVYRSDTFNTFSGFKKAEIVPTLDWFFDKIHEHDKSRIKSYLAYCLANNLTHWENEYRFQIADGSYRHLLDKGYALFEEGKLTRVIGSMQDITERKRLEAQLLNEQVQKQKMINQATIKAQERERNRISGELHDNVNQLLMSAKLHVCVAKSKGEGPGDLLERANEYLLMAVAEIRELSKGLSSVVISDVGLQKSIADIAATMLLLQGIQVHTYISNEVISKLSSEQQLMVYRIIQEQTNNILKYAETTEAIISIKEVDQNVELIISDSGKGFDRSEQKGNGIGFINIFNRVDAYNGKVEIISSAGNGCTLIINFPLTEL